MKKTLNTFVKQNGFSLAEILAALTVGALVLVAVMAVYNRAQRSAEAISRHLDRERISSEVLQLIAEDLDGIVDAGKNVKITITNKWESHGFHTARFEILKNIYDDQQRPQVLEKIIWQGHYDYDGNSKALVLYRSHSGIGLEDKLLEEEKEEFERELFVPVCSGVTFFAVEVPQGEDVRDDWTSDTLPAGIVATLSFAEPMKTASGTLEMPDYEKTRRTVAIDRTRKIKFIYVPPPEYEDQNQPPEPNEIKQEPNEPNKPIEPNEIK